MSDKHEISPPNDPAISDLRAAEVEDHARMLLGAVRENAALRLMKR